MFTNLKLFLPKDSTNNSESPQRDIHLWKKYSKHCIFEMYERTLHILQMFAVTS